MTLSMKKSVFNKIRISPHWTRKTLQEFGFRVEAYDIYNGVVCIIALKK